MPGGGQIHCILWIQRHGDTKMGWWGLKKSKNTYQNNYIYFTKVCQWIQNNEFLSSLFVMKTRLKKPVSSKINYLSPCFCYCHWHRTTMRLMNWNYWKPNEKNYRTATIVMGTPCTLILIWLKIFFLSNQAKVLITGWPLTVPKGNSQNKAYEFKT